MSVIEIEQLTRRYGSRTGVEQVTLRVDEGSLFGFLGPNGAGKTTLFHVLTGLLPSRAGSIELDGNRIRPRGPESMPLR